MDLTETELDCEVILPVSKRMLVFMFMIFVMSGVYASFLEETNVVDVLNRSLKCPLID